MVEEGGSLFEEDMANFVSVAEIGSWVVVVKASKMVQ